MDDNKYDDEDIINLRWKLYDYGKLIERMKNDNENNIENGYAFIGGYKVLFSDRIIKDRVKIALPSDFEEMDEIYAVIKYPNYSNEDKVIFTNRDTTVNFMFDFGECLIAAHELETVRDQLFEVVKKAHPALEFIEKGYEKSSLADVAYFEIVTSAADKDIYNFMYFFIVQGKLVAAAFNCFDDERDNWRPVIRQVIKSVRIV